MNLIKSGIKKAFVVILAVLMLFSVPLMSNADSEGSIEIKMDLSYKYKRDDFRVIYKDASGKEYDVTSKSELNIEPIETGVTTGGGDGIVRKAVATYDGLSDTVYEYTFFFEGGIPFNTNPKDEAHRDDPSIFKNLKDVNQYLIDQSDKTIVVDLYNVKIKKDYYYSHPHEYGIVRYGWTPRQSIHVTREINYIGCNSEGSDYDMPVFDGQDKTNSFLLVSNNDSAHPYKDRTCNFYNFQLQNYENGICSQMHDGSKIKGMVFKNIQDSELNDDPNGVINSNNRAEAVLGIDYINDAVVEDNEFRDLYGTSSYFHGIYLAHHCNNTVIRNNFFLNTSIDAVTMRDDITNAKMEENYFYDSGAVRSDRAYDIWYVSTNHNRGNSNKEITYTAKWKDDKNRNGRADGSEKFTVIFRDGDTVYSSQSDLSIGGAVTTPADPTKQNHTFAGWDRDVQSTVRALDADTESKIVYNAIWKGAPNYTVIFKDGSTILQTFENMEDGESIDVDVPTKTDYVFDKWSRDFNGKVDKSLANNYKQIIYSAKWKDDKNRNGQADESEKFTVIFRDGDTVYSRYSDLSLGTLITLPEDPTKANHSFTLWDRPLVGMVRAEDANAGSEIIYNATWAEVEKYTVFFKDGETTLRTFEDKADGDSIDMPDPIKTGYVFDKWDKSFESKVDASLATKYRAREDESKGNVFDKNKIKKSSTERKQAAVSIRPDNGRTNRIYYFEDDGRNGFVQKCKVKDYYYPHDYYLDIPDMDPWIKINSCEVGNTLEITDEEFVPVRSVIRHVDKNGKALRANDVIVTNGGETFTAQAKADLIGADGNPIYTSDYKTKLYDESGKEVTKDAEGKSIVDADGYIKTDGSGALLRSLKNDNQTFTFVYAPSARLTINHKDADGTLLKTETKNTSVGERYNLKKISDDFLKDNKNYELIDTIDDADKEVGDSEVVVTLHYKKKPSVDTDDTIDYSSITDIKELEKHIPVDVSSDTPAPAAAVEDLMLKTESEDDVKGSSYLPLKFQSKKQKTNAVTLKWSKVSGAEQYVIYGNLCNTKGKKYKMVKIATLKGSKKSYTVKKIEGKKLKKGTYYKFVIVAQKGDKVIAAAKTIHVATSGSKNKSNYTGVNVDKKIIAKAKKLKKGASLSLKAKPSLKKGTKAQSHIKGKLRYESSNRMIATVSKNGKIKAREKGMCYIYVYTQSGIAKKIKLKIR